jgi:hypothetical protein
VLPASVECTSVNGETAAGAARAAYREWGWWKVTQKRNPLPGSPVFDVMVKELR